MHPTEQVGNSSCYLRRDNYDRWIKVAHRRWIRRKNRLILLCNEEFKLYNRYKGWSS